MIAFWRAEHHDRLLAGAMGFVTRFPFMINPTNTS